MNRYWNDCSFSMLFISFSLFILRLRVSNLLPKVTISTNIDEQGPLDDLEWKLSLFVELIHLVALQNGSRTCTLESNAFNV